MEFKDRKPTLPNRYKITPENGGGAYYATLVRADEPTEVGTPLNAENLHNLVNDAIENQTSETWVFTLLDGSTVTKVVRVG